MSAAAANRPAVSGRPGWSAGRQAGRQVDRQVGRHTMTQFKEVPFSFCPRHFLRG